MLMPPFPVLTIWFGVVLASTKVGRGYAGVIMYVPGFLGALLVNLLPSNNKIGLLFGYWLVSMCFPLACSVVQDSCIDSFLHYALRHLLGLGWLVDSWTYQTYHHQLFGPDLLCDWQLRITVYLAEEVPATVCVLSSLT